VRNMKKDTARQRVRDAVRYGKIAKPEKCSVCGAITEPSKLHGHHHKGYENPLDVQWVCVHCHNVKDRESIVANGFRMRSNLIPGASHLVKG
jgi:hypothetical protein